MLFNATEAYPSCDLANEWCSVGNVNGILNSFVMIYVVLMC